MCPAALPANTAVEQRMFFQLQFPQAGLETGGKIIINIKIATVDRALENDNFGNAIATLKFNLEKLTHKQA